MKNRSKETAEGKAGSGARMTPRTAAVVLIVAVVAVGAIGYFVLNAVTVVHTHTQNSCASPAAPDCSGPTHTSSPDTVVAIAAGAPVRG